MSFNCGIVGLPNVGKSTLFNALVETQIAESANYPFCTIEPNKGYVSVPDKRLTKLAQICNSEKIIPTQLEFVDIAGLVKGASKGEGLGNKFLANIREVDTIVHVLRCFKDDNITHIEGKIDPIRDADIVDTELMIADMELLENRIRNMNKKLRNNKSLQKEMDLMLRILKLLEAGRPIREVELKDEEEQRMLRTMALLTSKPVLYVCNVDEESVISGNEDSKKVFERANKENTVAIVVSAAIDSEVSQLNNEDKMEFLLDLGLEETGLNRVIRASYKLLDQLTFFTAGPKEARSWTIKKGSLAPNAAGAIHGDFERGFICADTIYYDDYVAYNGEKGAKEAGKMRQEGRDYIVKDGDIFHFKFNV